MIGVEPPPLEEELAGLLRQSAEEAPAGFVEQNAASRLARTLELGVPTDLDAALGAIEATSPVPNGLELALKAFVSAKGVLVSTAVLAGATVALSAGPSEPKAPPAAPPSTSVRLERPAAASVRIERTEPAQAAQPEIPVADAAVPAPVPKQAAAKPQPLLTEVRHLAQVRRLIQQNPGRAALMAREGHQLYLGGMLYQEREALLILALDASGGKAEARRRAHDYLGRFPRGALSERVRGLASER